MDEDSKQEIATRIGKLNIFLEQQISETRDLFRSYREFLAGKMESVASDSEAETALNEWLNEISSDDAFSEQIYQGILKSEMAGFLYVATQETKEVQLAGEVTGAFFNLPFQEALEFFLSKRIISPEEFNRLSKEARDSAFTARRLLAETLRQTAYDQLRDAIDNQGGTYADFAEALRSEETSLGTEPADDHYLRNVYHTNLADAYNKGKREMLTDRIRQRRPYIVRRAVGDARTRASHLGAHNKAVRADSDLADIWTGLWGFQCRCSWVTMTEEQIEERGIEVWDFLPEGIGPDEDFQP